MSDEQSEKARKRMSVILRVEAGLMTATAGAAELGISRQAFYEWSNRAMDAMTESLADRPAGRPSNALDPQVERLEQELTETKADLSRAILALDIRKTLELLRSEAEISSQSGLVAKKNTKQGRKQRKR